MIGPGREARRRLGRFEIGLALIALTGLIGRWAYVLLAKRPADVCTGADGARQLLCGDALYYKAQADTIAAGRWFEDPFRAGWPAADHPPVTALVLAPVSWVTGGDHIAMRLFLGVLGAVTIVLIGLLGKRLAGPRAGLLAAGIAAVNPNLWVNDGVLMSETLATLLFVIVVLLVYRLWDAPTRWRAVLVGVALGLLTLTRAELAMYLPFVVLPMLLVRRGLAVKRALTLVVLAGVAAGAVLVPWTAYNLTRFRQPVVISTNDGLTLWGANCESTYYGGGVGYWDLGCYFAVEPTLDPGGDQSERSAELRRLAQQYIGDHTSRLPAVVVIRVGRLWGVYQPDQLAWLGQGEGREPWVSWAAWDALWVLLPLAGMGTWILWRRRFAPLWPLVSTFAIATFTAVIFYGLPRFRIAADVAMGVLAAVALDEGIRRWLARHARRTEPARAGRLPTLDGYRAVAVVLVLLNHAAFATGFGSRSELGQFLARAAVGVPIFFVLSAFLLYRPFAEAHTRGLPPPPWREYLRHRAVRVLPAFWFAIVGIWLIEGFGEAGLRSVLGTALVLPALGVPVKTCDLGTCSVGYALAPAWTIGVQLVFYALLPLYDRLARRLFPRGRSGQLLIGVAGIYAVGLAARIALVAADPSWARQATFTVLLWLDVFALGMALAVVRLPRHEDDPRVAAAGAFLDRTARLVWPWWLGAGLLTFVGTRVSPPGDPFGLGTQGALVRVFCFGLAAALALVPGFFGPQDEGLLRRLLAAPPLRWLGLISLSFFLWHLPILEKVKEWIVPDYPALRELARTAGPDNPLGALAVFTGSFWRVTALTFVVTFVVATFVYLIVERPFASLRDRSVRDALHAALTRPPAATAPEADRSDPGAPGAGPAVTVDTSTLGPP